MKTKIIAFLCCVLLISFLFVVSILGENSKIDATAVNFLSNYENSKLATADSSRGGYISHQEIEHYILKLSLLKYFGLLGRSEFSIETKQDKIWIPFLTQSVLISVRLNTTSKSNFTPFKENNNTFINNILEMQRIDGYWKITNTHIESSPISITYNQLFDKFDKYFNNIIKDGDTISLNTIKMSTNQYSHEDIALTNKIFEIYIRILKDKHN